MRAWTAVVVMALLTGCGSSTAPQERTEWRQRVDGVQLLEPGEIEDRDYRVLDEVAGKSCVQSRGARSWETFDELGTVQAAKEQTRIAAEKLGAEAVTNLVCVTEHLSRQGMDRCAKRYRCTGDAIRFTE